jgi:cysteine synthase B
MRTTGIDAASELLESIGRTPLFELEGFDLAPGARILAKLESTNPGGSIKDRPVAHMVLAALREGRLAGGRRLLDSSSGNAGVAYAMIGARLGVPVTLVVPGNASRERLERMRAHGAELVLTDPVEGYDFALREARRLAREQPERYWHCDQYSNPGNVRAHFETTGAELLAQVVERAGRPPDVLVAGVGTGGTLTGVARRLLEANPRLHVVALIPETFPGIEGLKPLGHPGDIVPAILDESLIRERIPVTLERAAELARALAARGFFVGPSSGAYLHGALELARREPGAIVATLFSDTGERYGSTGLWEAAAPAVTTRPGSRAAPRPPG